MIRIKKYFLFILLFGLVFSLLPANFVSAASVLTPIILELDQHQPETINRPLITGLTGRNTDVLVYIDNDFAGIAHINSSNTATDNFYYQHPQPLPNGNHTIMVIAKDKTSLLLSPASDVYGFYIAPLAAPTLVEPNLSTVTEKPKPIITGLTRSGTFVHIYIDGVYNGKTDVLVHESGTANFAYQPFLNLGTGKHIVQAISEDLSGQKSSLSGAINFNIEQRLPAPIIYQPVVNKNTNPRQPIIVGNVKNNSKVRVYIDKILDGEFQVNNHESGTANFAYQPFLPLSIGKHFVYTEAVDSRGKVSRWSNIIYFNVSGTAGPVISAEGAEETDTAEKEDSTVGEEAKDDAGKEIAAEEGQTDIKEPPEDEAKESATSTAEETGNPDINDIEEILQGDAEESKDKTGLINEEKEQQSKLNLNLVVFIVFLLAVIIWIFWVNRELIKEKRKQMEEEEKNKENKPKLDI